MAGSSAESLAGSVTESPAGFLAKALAGSVAGSRAGSAIRFGTGSTRTGCRTDETAPRRASSSLALHDLNVARGSGFSRHGDA